MKRKPKDTKHMYKMNFTHRNESKLLSFIKKKTFQSLIK